MPAVHKSNWNYCACWAAVLLSPKKWCFNFCHLCISNLSCMVKVITVYFLLLFNTSPSSSLLCVICMGCYSQVRIHMLLSFQICGRGGKGTKVELHNSVVSVGCHRQLAGSITLAGKLQLAHPSKSLLGGVHRGRSLCQEGTGRSVCSL